MTGLTSRRWFCPLAYVFLIVLCFWPPYTQQPFDPRQTQVVIMEILTNSTRPYADYGWIFHVATLAAAGLAIYRPSISGRVVAAYFGLNYLIVAAVQTHAITPSYGLAIQTGALAAEALLGILWLRAAWRGSVDFSLRGVPAWRWLLFPFALLAFWLPMAWDGSHVIFHVDPVLLLTSPDYGLAYCFMTPVFLFFLILAYPRVDGFAFKLTAFNALLYGLLNLVQWFSPDTRVLGVMHLPLLVMALVSLVLARGSRVTPQAA